MRTLNVAAFAAAIVLLPGLALAHTGIHAGLGTTSGFAAGFLHPFMGIDHILAMTMVGLFAWQLGGRAIWLVPASFVSLMALGGALGVAGIHVPFVEAGIALSIVVLGGIVACKIRTPTAIAMGLVGLFAIFHGHAHGTEMPMNAGGMFYGVGFMLATALLHGLGLSMGFLIGRIGERAGSGVVRVAGGIASVIGLALLAI